MYREYLNELNKLEEEYLVESSELYSGVFWIVDLNNINANRRYCFTIPSNPDGSLVVDDYSNLNAKSGTTYNHEKLWKQLSSNITFNKPFDYYPRGRVQIANNKAIVYLNPHINTDEIQKFIIDEFNLILHNGINKVTFNSDGSNHYRCYLDK